MVQWLCQLKSLSDGLVSAPFVLRDCDKRAPLIGENATDYTLKRQCHSSNDLPNQAAQILPVGRWAKPLDCGGLTPLCIAPLNAVSDKDATHRTQSGVKPPQSKGFAHLSKCKFAKLEW